VTSGELLRNDLIFSEESDLWGNVVYAINEMGFAFDLFLDLKRTSKRRAPYS